MQYRAFNFSSFSKSKYAKNLSDQELKELELVSHILPFKVNNYILDELIDWNNKETDPMFNLYFFNKHMLHSEQLDLLQNSYYNTKTIEAKNEIIKQIRSELNPHPAKQMTANVPILNNKRIKGLQHKYKETCLIFPKSGQTCHSYCTFCFRWAQFIGDDDQKFYTDSSGLHIEYIKKNKEITDLLFTGGDPMIMSVLKLKEIVSPFLSNEFEHIKNIRIGTKSIVNFPYKYVNDKETSALLSFFDDIIKTGKHLSIMAHINHWIEMESNAFKIAIKNIRNTGAEIRTQSPILNNINDNSDIWIKMWQQQVKLGLIPYYMFIERETGAEKYFNIPLFKAFNIFKEAYKQVSGLCKTVKGPSMSAIPGKVVIDGVIKIEGKKYFVLNFLQARNPDWIKQPFLAEYDETSTWLFQLNPYGGKFFFMDELEKMVA